MTISVSMKQKTSDADPGEANIVSRTASLSDVKTTRWSKNILLWITYLPHDCVKSMIRMGWHDST